jgi:hypothetical protein
MPPKGGSQKLEDFCYDQSEIMVKCHNVGIQVLYMGH